MDPTWPTWIKIGYVITTLALFTAFMTLFGWLVIYPILDWVRRDFPVALAVFGVVSIPISVGGLWFMKRKGWLTDQAVASPQDPPRRLRP